MRRGLLLLLLLCLVCAGAGACVRISGAAFTYGSTSTVTAACDHVRDWLHLYSSATDPDGGTGYSTRAGYTPTKPAATGQDENLTVHLGAYPNRNQNYDSTRVLSLKPPASFPAGVTRITAAFSLIADPATGRQPISSMGVRTWGTTGVTGTSVTVSNWAPGVKYQLNLRVNLGNWTKQQYVPKIRVVVTFSGFTTTYYRYEIPVKVTYGASPGPD